MKNAQQILNDQPGHSVFAVPPNYTVFQALQVMAEKDIGAILVMENDGLVGIFSERDYARKVVLQGKTSSGTLISTIMTTKVWFAKPTQTLDECMAIMSEKRVRHIPVLDGERVLGVLSISDLVKAQIADQRHTIEHLEHYIHG